MVDASGRAAGGSDGPRGLVLWHVTMSLDGFIAGAGDAMDWVFEYPPSTAVSEVVVSLGAVLVGHRSYQVSRRPGQIPQATKAYGGAWDGPQFVLTHRPEDAPPDPAVTFLSGDVGAAVGTARAAAGGRDVAIIGADVARQCLAAGLVDEIFVHLAPVLLGAGIRLLDSPELGRVALEPVSVSWSGQLTDLRFRVVRR